MMKLYELNEQIRNFNMEFDEETGEWLNEEELNSLQLERDTKLENLACYIKELRAEGDAVSKEAGALKDRADKCYTKADRIEEFLAHELNGETISSERVLVSWRKSERVEFTDESKIPEEYIVTKTTIDRKPDKTAIKKAINSGKKVTGAIVKKYNNIKII